MHTYMCIHAHTVPKEPKLLFSPFGNQAETPVWKVGRGRALLHLKPLDFGQGRETPYYFLSEYMAQ